MDMNEIEGDIEPVAAAVEEQKIDTIKDAIKNVLKKSMAQDGKLSDIQYWLLSQGLRLCFGKHSILDQVSNLVALNTHKDW